MASSRGDPGRICTGLRNVSFPNAKPMIDAQQSHARRLAFPCGLLEELFIYLFDVQGLSISAANAVASSSGA